MYVGLEVEELVEHLKEQWENSANYRYNPDAFQLMKSTGGHLMFCCPFHQESRPSFGVMLNPGYGFNCFSCETKGTIEMLVSHVLGLGELKASFYIEKYFCDSGNYTEAIKCCFEKLRDIGKPLYTNMDEEAGLKFKGIRHPYLWIRGFSERAVDMYEIGYDKDTDTIVVPIRDSGGGVRFLQRRSVGHKRFLNQKDVMKKDILFGLYHIKRAIFKEGKQFDKIFITESALDTVACYQAGLPSISIMGRILYDEQIEQLKRLPISSVVLFLDNDGHGREATEIAVSKLKKKTKFGVYQVVYPSKVNKYTLKLCKDANELLVNDALEDIAYKVVCSGITKLLHEGAPSKEISAFGEGFLNKADYLLPKKDFCINPLRTKLNNALKKW
jgi:hypothetical protein